MTRSSERMPRCVALWKTCCFTCTAGCNGVGEGAQNTTPTKSNHISWWPLRPDMPQIAFRAGCRPRGFARRLVLYST